MEPTSRARQLLAPLNEAMSKLREALETKTRFQPEASEREFRVATNDHVEALILPRLVRRLRRKAPSAAVRTVRTEYLFLPPVDDLQAGDLDVALGFFGDIQEPRSGLLTHRLSAERLVCILRASHPRANRRLSLQAFAGIPHARIMYPRREHFGTIDPIVRSHGLSRRITVTVPHYSAIPPVVAQSDLLGVVPETLARRVAGRLRLKIFDPPVALYARGDASLLERTCVAVVGSRKPTPYGSAVAERLAADLAARGAVIVSGMARGVDTCAHRGALDAGGKTIAVLGCGIDQCYPSENRKLKEQIEQNGLKSGDTLKNGNTAAKSFNGTMNLLKNEITTVDVGEKAFTINGTGQLHMLYKDYYVVVAFDADEYGENNAPLNILIGKRILANLKDKLK
jgi:DNA-binding transcriptional LysR family regulator